MVSYVLVGIVPEALKQNEQGIQLDLLAASADGGMLMRAEEMCIRALSPAFTECHRRTMIIHGARKLKRLLLNTLLMVLLAGQRSAICKAYWCMLTPSEVPTDMSPTRK